jgi:hypothetical protein
MGVSGELIQFWAQMTESEAEIKSDRLMTPALEKHAKKGVIAAEASVDGCSARRMLRMCLRAPASLW